jgi:hypothetical protein
VQFLPWCSAGLAGLANGLYVLLLGNGAAKVTFALLIIEGVLGWFFFSVFVLSSYPFMVARAAAPMPGLTGSQSNAVIMMVRTIHLTQSLHCHSFTYACHALITEQDLLMKFKRKHAKLNFKVQWARFDSEESSVPSPGACTIKGFLLFLISLLWWECTTARKYQFSGQHLS